MNGAVPWAVLLLAAVATYVVAVSLSAPLPPRGRTKPTTNVGLDAGLLRAPEAAPDQARGGRRLAARALDRAVLAGVALGMAVALHRTVEAGATDAIHGHVTWVATFTPAASPTHRALRVQPSSSPR